MARKPSGLTEAGDTAPEVVLLSDEPSDVDEFDARAHDRVATAIADLIQREPGGKVIGLEGSWGSGKSTVVRLLSKHLVEGASRAGHRETQMVIFDAWAHQGDRLRRTFLETLINALEAADWLPKALAGDLRGKLTGKSSTTHTKSTERLSGEGRVTAAAVTLIPVGAALVGSHFWLGVALLLAPALVVTLFALAKFIGVWLGGKKQTAGWRWKLADLRAFSFFAKEQDTDTETKGVEHGEPTSVEFETWFSDVLNEAVKDDRRLVIVLDNIDRVDESDARSILSTMQTFAGAGTRVGSIRKPSVWTLIPYDPAGLDRLWNPDAAERDGTDVAADRPLTSLTSAAFAEKIFQVCFEAPPLVLSDWRDYLVRLLSLALPGTEQDEFLAVLRLRALYPSMEPNGLVSKEAPTPRQLKQFVNQIGAVRRQRRDIPLVHVAYYALLRRDRVNVAHGLIHGTLPHLRLTYLFAAGVGEDLAALHFGTTQSLGQQLLLGGELEKALSAGNSAAVAELKVRSGFGHTLESLDLGSRLADGGIELTTSVAVLDAAEAFEIPGVAAWLEGALLPLARTCPSWSLAGRDSGAGLAMLFDSLASDDTAFSELLAKIVPSPRDADAEGLLQLEGVAGLADVLIKRGRSAELVRIRVEIPVVRLSASLAFFGAQTSEDGSRAALELTSTPAEVASALVQTATGERFIDVDMALDVLLMRPARVDLGSLGAGCVSWLQGQDAASAAQLDTLLKCVDRTCSAVASESFLGAAADDGTLMHVVSFAVRSGWYAQAASASMLHLVARPGLPEPAATREAAAGAQIVRQSLGDPSINPEIVAAQLVWLERHSGEAFGFLTNVWADSTFRPWVDHQLCGLSDASALVVSADQYLQTWQQLRSALPNDSFVDLTRGLFGHTGDRSTIIAASSDPALAVTAIQASSPDSGESRDVRGWACGIVISAVTTAWESALASLNGGPLLDLAVALAGNADAPSDPPGLSDALHSHFQALAAGEAAWEPGADTFGKLTSLLGAATRRATARRLCATLEVRDGVVGSGLLPTYGTFLAGERAFRTHATLPNFIERAVAHDQWESVEWIVDVARKHRDTLQPNARQEEIERLRNTVREKLSELTATDTAPPEPLTALSELLGS